MAVFFSHKFPLVSQPRLSSNQPYLPRLLGYIFVVGREGVEGNFAASPPSVRPRRAAEALRIITRNGENILLPYISCFRCSLPLPLSGWAHSLPPSYIHVRVKQHDNFPTALILLVMIQFHMRVWGEIIWNASQIPTGGNSSCPSISFNFKFSLNSIQSIIFNANLWHQKAAFLWQGVARLLDPKLCETFHFEC